ncbi:MAG: hypothetical protein HEQ19_04345 [Gloeotrichia echinulata CP02]
MSLVICHLSFVSCQLSLVICHLSLVITHYSLLITHYSLSLLISPHPPNNYEVKYRVRIKTNNHRRKCAKVVW